MAQAIQKEIQDSNHAIHQAAWGDLAGLTIETLTGAGWIELTLCISVATPSAYQAPTYFCFSIDGVSLDLDRAVCSPVANGPQSVTFSRLFKPGAGQHIFKVRDVCTPYATTVEERSALFHLKEFGF